MFWALCLVRWVLSHLILSASYLYFWSSLQQWSKRSKTTEDLRKMGFQRLETGLWSPGADAARVLWKLKVHRVSTADGGDEQSSLKAEGVCWVPSLVPSFPAQRGCSINVWNDWQISYNLRRRDYSTRVKRRVGDLLFTKNVCTLGILNHEHLSPIQKE